MSIDKRQDPFKGRLDFKQYMKARPGIKVFVLGDATNGYVYRLQIHTDRLWPLCARIDFLQLKLVFSQEDQFFML